VPRAEWRASGGAEEVFEVTCAECEEEEGEEQEYSPFSSPPKRKEPRSPSGTATLRAASSRLSGLGGPRGRGQVH
jgi:hypothetical protein